MYTMIVSIFFGIVCIIFFSIGVITRDQRMIKLGMVMAMMTMVVNVLSGILGQNYAAQYEEEQRVLESEQEPGRGDNDQIDMVGESAEDGVADLPLRMYMTVKSYDPQTQQLTVEISNQSGYEMTYGNEYSLRVKDGEEWKGVPAKEEYAWTEEAHILKDLEKAEEVYDLSYFGPLDPGTYMFCKTDLEAEFEVEK